MKYLRVDSPIACVSLVPFSFSRLNMNRKTHDKCATQGDGSVNQLNRTELNITDTITDMRNYSSWKNTDLPLGAPGNPVSNNPGIHYGAFAQFVFKEVAQITSSQSSSKL